MSSCTTAVTSPYSGRFILRVSYMKSLRQYLIKYPGFNEERKLQKHNTFTTTSGILVEGVVKNKIK